MDPYIHTILATAMLFSAWRFGKWQSTKDALERYTETLEEHGYVHIQKMRDGSYEFIKHWKHQAEEQSQEQ
jgi:hypothetical protein